MELLPLILTVVLILLAVVLTVVGVQLFVVLLEFRRTLKRVNETIDMAENRLVSVMAPFQSLGGAVSGMRAGFKVFELFVSWLNKSKNND